MLPSRTATESPQVSMAGISPALLRHARLPRDGRPARRPLQCVPGRPVREEGSSAEARPVAPTTVTELGREDRHQNRPRRRIPRIPRTRARRHKIPSEERNDPPSTTNRCLTSQAPETGSPLRWRYRPSRVLGKHVRWTGVTGSLPGIPEKQGHCDWECLAHRPGGLQGCQRPEPPTETWAMNQPTRWVRDLPEPGRQRGSGGQPRGPADVPIAGTAAPPGHAQKRTGRSWQWGRRARQALPGTATSPGRKLFPRMSGWTARFSVRSISTDARIDYPSRTRAFESLSQPCIPRSHLRHHHFPRGSYRVWKGDGLR
jgi:hypothetical protein